MTRFKGRFCNSVGVHYKIVDLKICINGTNSRWLLPKSWRALPMSCRVCLRGMVTWLGAFYWAELEDLEKSQTHGTLRLSPVWASCRAHVFYFWGIVWVTVIFFIDRPDQRSMLPDLNKTVSLHLTDQAWLRPCCGSHLSLSFILSSLLQPDTLPQLPQIAL